MKPTVFSGARPSGQFHLGNYLGLVKKAIELQDTECCIYGIVDLHGITTPYEPEQYSSGVLEVALDYLACGIDPEKSILMMQSLVPEHVELAYLLGTLTPVGLLERIPTFKEKIKQHPDYVNLGLLSYPVLMAADILVYKATKVPVGEDQLPHIEFANDLGRKFNHRFGETFPKISVVLGDPRLARIKSLENPLEKMSKTGNAGIALNDTPEEIKKKIAKAVTDVGPSKTREMSLGVENLFTLMSAFSSHETYKSFEQSYTSGTLKYSEFKTQLGEDIANYFAPFREKRKKLSENKEEILSVLRDGSQKARLIAQETLREVKEKMGFIL